MRLCRLALMCSLGGRALCFWRHAVVFSFNRRLNRSNKITEYSAYDCFSLSKVMDMSWTACIPKNVHFLLYWLTNLPRPLSSVSLEKYTLSTAAWSPQWCGESNLWAVAKTRPNRPWTTPNSSSLIIVSEHGIHPFCR